MEQSLLKLMGQDDYVPSDFTQLLRRLGQESQQRRHLKRSLRKLENAGRIARQQGDRYVLPEDANLISGRIQITIQGRGFLIPDSSDVPEVAIPALQTETALHGDHVLVKPHEQTGGGRWENGGAIIGTVTRVLQRRRTQFVGTLHRSRRGLSVLPDDPRMPHKISVPPLRERGRPGDKVVVKLLNWNSPRTTPQGVVTEVLGPPHAPGVAMLGVLRQYDLSPEFPAEALKEARRFGTEVTAADLEGRTDCRNHPVITIDPEDAKDFDDAFSLQRSGPKRWKLRIHIADVSHYVKPGAALDAEARKRGNSTYLVDRVIPMLPETLSNELCSLRPHVDRLSKCVEFLLSDDGRVLQTRFYSAVIHSKRRYTYEEAMEVLRSDRGDPLEQMLRKSGCAGSEHPPAKVPQWFTRSGVSGGQDPARPAWTRDRDGACQIRSIPSTDRRIHVAGERGRSGSASEKSGVPACTACTRDLILCGSGPIVKRCSVTTCLAVNLEKPAEVRRLLDRLDRLPIGSALKIGFLKSLTRARYAVEPLGHYGLAKSEYAHFTSPDPPLRRPRGAPESLRSASTRDLPSRHRTSYLRRGAMLRRRGTRQQDRQTTCVSQGAIEFRGNDSATPALVTDIREFGFFVEVHDLGLTGLVPFSNRGGAPKRTIRLGEEVTVEVCKVDSTKRRVDFRRVTGARDERSTPNRSRRSKQSRTGDTEKTTRITENSNRGQKNKSSRSRRRRPSRRRRSTAAVSTSNS